MHHIYIGTFSISTLIIPQEDMKFGVNLFNFIILQYLKKKIN